MHVSRRSRKTSLKLHQDSSGALNTVTGYGADYVEINLERHTDSIIVLPDSPVIEWPVSSFEALSPEHFALLIEPAPEVVIFGSGERLRFPHPRLTVALSARRIGVETMDFKAACRTYNILMAEGRKVAAALLIER
ncbi:Mth938-like domain-containing protein [Paraburkholderia bengalensis]|uniref:Mth938-like domain-containing protein n=1 Tax=Paraburkholderia bengalensis TaxID=2747562 RepID=A0ABU8IY71_9BURK